MFLVQFCVERTEIVMPRRVPPFHCANEVSINWTFFASQYQLGHVYSPPGVYWDKLQRQLWNDCSLVPCRTEHENSIRALRECVLSRSGSVVMVNNPTLSSRSGHSD